MQNLIFVGENATDKSLIARMLSIRKNMEFYDTSELTGTKKQILKKIKKFNSSISLEDKFLQEEDDRDFIQEFGKVIYLSSSQDKNVDIYNSVLTYIINIDFKTTEEVFREVILIYNLINKLNCHIYIK